MRAGADPVRGKPLTSIMQTKHALAIAAALLILAGGIWLGRASVPVQVPDVVAPAPAQSLPAGAVVLERKPAKPEAVKPIKPGSKVERAASVTVQTAREDCPPVTVDMQLIQEGDGRRIVARSPDGRVIAGMDIPVRQIDIEQRRDWAAGISCDPTNCQRTPGIWVDRDIGRVRVGAELARQSDGETQIRARVGWTW